MKNLLILLCGIFLTSQGNCQKVVGRIVDDAGKPISNVEVFIEGDTILTYSNYLGFFEIQTNNNESSLLASHISYSDVKVDIGGKEKVMFVMNKISRKLPQLKLYNFSKENMYDIDPDELYENEDYKVVANDTILLINNNAKFIGGSKALYNYVGEHFMLDSIPKSAMGTVSVAFTVDKIGIVKDVIVAGDTLHGIAGFSRDAFTKMPNWKPAKQGSVNVDQYFNVEILYGTPIFLVVETSATFVGGMNPFYEYVAKKMQGKYPAQARRAGIEGKVFVQFVVEQDGTIDPQSITVMKGIGGGCDELAISVVRDSPPWNPGTHRGKAVRQRMVIPIFFKLN